MLNQTQSSREKSLSFSTASSAPIPVFRPSYGEEEVQAVRECLEKGWTGCGPKVKAFEAVFAEFIGVPFAVATNSCTASLHLALKVLDLEGAEVVTTPMTFVSTNHAILYNRAVPVFADIDPNTLNIDPESIAKRITDKTKAIMVMHFGGHACDMDAIMAIAEKHKLYVIEDCAHACGGEYKGKKLGSIGHLGCFSFHAVKNLAIGDGGMITMRDEKLRDRFFKLRWVGISKDTWDRNRKEGYSWDYDVHELGFKYQMNDIAAAIGLEQLKKLDALNEKRRVLAAAYDQAFQGLHAVEPLKVYAYTKKAHHNYVLKAERRDELMAFLKERKISSSVHYRPNNHFSVYRSGRGETPVSETVWKKLVTLPLFPDLRPDQQNDIIQSVRSFFLL